MGRDVPKAPTPKTAAQARAALEALASLPRKKGVRTFRVRAEGQEKAVTVTVPREAFDLLVEILRHLGNGLAVSVAPLEAELTTQQAAAILNVSRPYLVGLLDQGDIPCRMVGSHRRVRLADVVAYKTKDDRKRRAVVDRLTQEAEKLGLEY